MSINKYNPTTGELELLAGGTSTLYAEAPVGSIIPYGGTTAPDGFLLCQGQTVSRTTYAELFAVIGTSFGSGNGSTTFNVPDLREATTKGVGLSGKSNNHFDSDGVALGEFVEDRVKTHQHTYSGNTGDMNKNATGYMYPVGFTSDETPGHTGNITKIQNGRGMWRAEGTNKKVVEGYSVYIDVSHTHAFSGTTDEAGGATTEVKAVGVNYIIKATQVGVPADFAPVDVIENGNMKAVTSNAVADVMPEYYNKQLTITVYEQAQLSVTLAYLRGQKVLCKDGKTRIFGKIILGGVGNPNGMVNRHPCKITGFPGPVTILTGRLPCSIWSGWTGFFSMDNLATGVFAPTIAGPGGMTAEEACFTPVDVVVEVTE